MARSRLCTPAVALVLAFVVGASAAAAREPGEAPPPHKSVYGKLLTVNARTNTVIMKSDEGENLSWRFEKEVVAEAAGFEPGVPVIVIYRLLPSGVKRVTALAFPGVEKSPTYVNMTGARVVLRSAPAVSGACDAAGTSDATESVIPPGGRAEVLEACWCCATPGSSCATTTQSGAGRAYLVQCFE